MDTISITSIDNLKKRKKLNLYLNDNNKYVINAIKMRKKHLSIINDKINLSKEFKKSIQYQNHYFQLLILILKLRKKEYLINLI